MNLSNAITKNPSSNKGDYAMQFPTIQQNTDLQQVVDARELYQALGLDITQWARWSKQNIKDNPFALEGMDYGVYDLMSNTQGGRPTINYYLSIDFAKKLSMQVRTEKGEQVRNYFLECERKATQSSPVMPALPNFTNPADAAIAWAEEYKAKEAAQAEVIELKPKAEALARISSSKGATGIRDTAKAVGMRQNDFVAWCIDDTKPISRRFMYRDDRGVLNAYSHRTSAGLMTQKLQSFVGHDGRDRAEPRVKFTPAGVAKIAEMLEKERNREAELV